jgi:prepilin-type N-terminal cleavage/methylation domain-containing protein
VTTRRAQRGFSLIELAVAVLVIALLLGSILVPLGTQVEQRRISDSRRALEEIREALIGFAIINGRLPCPDTDSDPSAAGYGLEEAACSADPVTEGYLPWKTLGVAEMDAWGIRRTVAASPRIGDWRYRVDRNFAVTFTLATAFGADALTVRDSTGNALTSTSERPVAIIFSAGANTTADGQNALTSFEATSGIYQADVPSATFDDILIWISRPILFNRMVAAARLP